MKKLIVLACLATTVSMTAGTAMADSISGNLGVTARVGILSPSESDTDNGFVVGGGLIYGIDNNIAVDLEVSRTEFGSNTGDYGITDVSAGVQYRFASTRSPMVPYLGLGLNFLSSDSDFYDIDSTVGVHVKAGFDYFLQRNLALTAEAKMIAAAKADTTDNWTGNSVTKFDPSSLSATAGLRFFFN